MNILLWHVHGSWTTAFVHGPHRYLLPVTPDRGPDGLGRARTWDWPDTVVELSPEELREAAIDVVILQRPHEAALVREWLGREVPAIYLEHNTPGTDGAGTGGVPETRHPMADAGLQTIYLQAAADMTADVIEVAGSYSLCTSLYGKPITIGSSDRAAWEADQVEFDTEDGPCVEALRTGTVFQAIDLAEERRWPAWACPTGRHRQPPPPRFRPTRSERLRACRTWRATSGPRRCSPGRTAWSTAGTSSTARSGGS